MSNAQSINSLREVNARLLIKISELRRKFAEVEAENAKLKFVEQTVSDVDLSSSVINQQNNDDAKILEEKEINAFLVKINKKNISDKIREREQENLFITSAEFITFPKQVVKESIPAYKQTLASENTKIECQKIPYNQKVKQDLRQKLFFTV
ncbi:hypothetical protein C1645_832179 [Glomus cerebriforme]|uniref:Uncharacterized protein n=1 Tax=Glomus cerebriforme TaxID=658196 RepID=A0A397SPE8_9GLOM|nr:hypothetical protein C1645_832179 [Glomus cerebriforme]